MSIKLMVAATLGLLGIAGASYGQSTLTGTYSATSTESSGTAGYAPTPGFNFGTVNQNSAIYNDLTTLSNSAQNQALTYSPFSQSLTVGNTTTPDVFVSVAPQGGSSSVGTITGTVAVTFTGLQLGTATVTGVSVSSSTPGGAAATLSGGNITVAANYELYYGTNPQTDCIVWNATTCVQTSNGDIANTNIGDTLVVTFSNRAVVDINLYNWSDWTMYPEISFTQVSTGNVPEPASLTLLASAVAGLGAITRRRRRLTPQPR